MRSTSIIHPVPYLRGDSVCHTQCDLTGMVNASPHSTSDLGAYSHTIKSLSECNLLLLQIVNILQIITVSVFLVITTVIVFVTVITAFITFVVCVISRKKYRRQSMDYFARHMSKEPQHCHICNC